VPRRSAPRLRRASPRRGLRLPARPRRPLRRAGGERGRLRAQRPRDVRAGDRAGDGSHRAPPLGNARRRARALEGQGRVRALPGLVRPAREIVLLSRRMDLKLRWLYHILDASRSFFDSYAPPIFAKEKFIHASFQPEVLESARQFFPAG